MINKIVETRLFYRFAEMLIPIFAWLIILLPVYLSPFRPAVVAYFILGYFLYFLYKTIKGVYFASIGYQLMEKAETIDWHKKLLKTPGWQHLKHYIIIANYKETVEKVSVSLEKLAAQHYDLKNVIIVLAMEEREGNTAQIRSEQLTKKFSHFFGEIMTTYHPLIAGEVVGKASNEAYAGKVIYQHAIECKTDPKQAIITIADADSLFPPQYLAYLSLEFLKDKDRDFHFYWAPILLYNNFWKLSLPIRMQAILHSIIRISLLPQRDDLIQVSTYSTNLWLLHSVGFWDVDIIPEDWHIWLQAFFKHGEKVRTLPIYLPVIGDPVYTGSLMSSFVNRYEQERRWAWGATDIPYAIKQSLQSPHIPWIPKMRRIILLAEPHLLWPTSFFILTLSAWVPGWVNPSFGRTVLGYLLPQMSSAILTLGTLTMIITLYFDHKLREKVNIKTSMRNVPLLFIQWYLMPIVSFVFSSLPALEAHTRLILGKNLEYKVTEKA